MGLRAAIHCCSTYYSKCHVPIKCILAWKPTHGVHATYPRRTRNSSAYPWHDRHQDPSDLSVAVRCYVGTIPITIDDIEFRVAGSADGSIVAVADYRPRTGSVVGIVSRGKLLEAPASDWPPVRTV